MCSRIVWTFKKLPNVNLIQVGILKKKCLIFRGFLFIQDLDFHRLLGRLTTSSPTTASRTVHPTASVTEMSSSKLLLLLLLLMRVLLLAIFFGLLPPCGQGLLLLLLLLLDLLNL